MFWKKPIDKGLRFDFDSNNKRNYFRVVPPQPIPLLLDGQPATLIDIGAGGLAFALGNRRVGSLATARLTLPHPAAGITAELCIVSVDNNSICHAAFTKIDAAGSEAIHRYVLEIQKQVIRVKRDIETSGK